MEIYKLEADIFREGDEGIGTYSGLVRRFMSRVHSTNYRKWLRSEPCTLTEELVQVMSEALYERI